MFWILQCWQCDRDICILKRERCTFRDWVLVRIFEELWIAVPVMWCNHEMFGRGWGCFPCMTRYSLVKWWWSMLRLCIVKRFEQQMLDRRLDGCIGNIDPSRCMQFCSCLVRRKRFVSIRCRDREMRYLFSSSILLKIESINGIGYGSKFVSTFLRVLLKLAITRIHPFFFRTAKTGLLKPFVPAQGSMNPSLSMLTCYSLNSIRRCRGISRFRVSEWDQR